jgi:hypothetical protein
VSKQAAGKRIRFTGPASIQAMQLTFNQRNRVRFPGGVQAPLAQRRAQRPSKARIGVRLLGGVLHGLIV